jgi:hypothetical protein
MSLKNSIFLSHFYLEPALNNRSASGWKGFILQTDAELVQAVLDGDKQAFAVLVKRCGRPVRAVALDGRSKRLPSGHRHIIGYSCQAYEELA